MASSIERISTALDTTSLLSSIEPRDWDENTNRQEIAAAYHLDTESIFLRWAEHVNVESAFTDKHAVNKAAYYRLTGVEDLLVRFITAVNPTRLGRAILVKLKPDGAVRPHVDEGEYADYYERFHICLQTNPDSYLYVDDGESVDVASMNVGDLWWFNHKEKHWATNYGVTDRIHLIIDAVVPKFKRERKHD